MDEKKEDKPETKEPEKKPEDTGKGDKSKTATLYEQTNNATERLEKANEKTKELLNRQEAIYEKQKLGGMSEAGQPSKTQDELDDEEADKRVAAFQ